MPRKSSKSSHRRPSRPNVAHPDAPPANSGTELPDGGLPSLPFPVVGIGASAGGLGAFQKFLESLPTDTGMSFVLVQHLHPGHASMLTEILGRSTSLSVSEVADGTALEPNHIYVIPPGQSMVVSGGRLILSPRNDLGGGQRVVDTFLISLAQDQGHQSIGVILSGTATDGTLGCAEIKAAGGITFAQDDTAQHTGMPRSAIGAGSVDFVLPPDEIAREIARIGRHPHVRRHDGGRQSFSAASLASVVQVLRNASGVDFGHYKPNTLQRRISRRMALYKVSGVPEYVRLLAGNPGEVDALFQDILIHVTSFFRNPDVFDMLKSDVFPQLTENRSRDQPVRVWVIGCSTGEEAYSIAMAYEEYCEAAGRDVPLQVFASDLNGAALEKARAGVYPKSALQDLGSERLRRFFVELDGTCRIVKRIRDEMVFARHNVITDPPFSRIDLVSCRNLLIYMDHPLQARVLSILHYALNPGAYLLLGTSETIAAHKTLFDQQHAPHKIYVRRQAVPGESPIFAPRIHPPDPGGPVAPSARERGAGTERETQLQHEVNRLLLSRFVPAGVMIDAGMEILHFRGDTSPYLNAAPGTASLNLLKMLRQGLLLPVRSAIQSARKTGAAVRHENIRFRSGATERRVHVEVIPVPATASPRGNFLVLFDDGISPAGAANVAALRTGAKRTAATKRPTIRQENSQLKEELAAVREYLQSVIEQQEAANEELQSANEEAQSANEELQSINEELETSKEEVQSSNEELATVNSELNDRNTELGRINNDLVNLLASVQMAIVMLGPDLRLRRFTPAAEKMLNLIGGDIGRPIGDITLKIGIGDLEKRILEVMQSRSPVEIEVQDRQARWYSLRIRPYLTLDNLIDGAVLLLVDVDALKRVEVAIRASETRFQLLADTAPVLIWVHGPEGCQLVNRAYLEYLGVDQAAVDGDGWERFIHPDDRELHLAAYHDARGQRKGFEVQSRFRRHDGEYRWMKSVGRPRIDPGGVLIGYIGWSFDVTDLKSAEAMLRQADRSKDQFLAMLAHELRGPLAPLRNAVHLLTAMQLDEDQLAWAHETMDRQITHLSRMIDDLLDVSRITQGKIHLQKETADLGTLLAAAVDQVGPKITARRQVLTVRAPSAPIYLECDPVRLEQVIGNLLTNASKFTPHGGQILLSAGMAERSGGRGFVEIRVRDDGHGISAEMLPHVFDLFAQADSSLARSQGGLGIGLTLVQKLVELHGGMIEATSGGPGLGSEFIIRLPAVSTAPSRLPRTDGRRKPRPAGDSAWRVMVVDDNVDAGDTMAMLLKAWGHEVRVERDGEAAIEAAATFRPDIVLLDLGLPRKDGFEVARALRQLPGVRRPILAAISGYGQEDDQRRAREAGFDQHFTKPVDPLVLQEFLGRASWEDRVP
jgi:two-component system, chemotaxis family, CheB/CheR fusion protein